MPERIGGSCLKAKEPKEADLMRMMRKKSREKVTPLPSDIKLGETPEKSISVPEQGTKPSPGKSPVEPYAKEAKEESEEEE
mgnify:CR=1 FL=1